MTVRNLNSPVDGMTEDAVELDEDLFGLKNANVEQTGKWCNASGIGSLSLVE